MGYMGNVTHAREASDIDNTTSFCLHVPPGQALVPGVPGV
jgi:hypothetical protein